MLPPFLDLGSATCRSLSGQALCVLCTLAGPAAAQNADSRIDQPTPATLPPGTSTVPGNATDGADGRAARPGAIKSSTDVMTSPGGKAAQGTDPVEHLPKDMR